MKECKCEWCHGVPNPSGNGYCRKHYDQIRKYGHVLDVRSRYDDNRIEIKDGYAEIILTDLKDNVIGSSKISLEDIEKVKGHRWTTNGNGYVRTFEGTSPLYLHRLITNCPADLEVDHINHDRSDNRRENLRAVTKAVNVRNTLAKCVRQVTDRRLNKPYYAKIVVNGKTYFSKYFETEEQATAVVKRIRKKVAEL